MALLKAGNYSTECRAVLFDKDGTLIDFKNMWFNWLNYMFNSLIAHYGLNSKQAFKDFEEAIGVDLERHWIDPAGIMASGSMVWVRNEIANCLNRYGVGVEEARETFYNTVLVSEREIDWDAITLPVPGLEKLLQELMAKDIKVGVVTADNTRRAENALIALGLSSYFEIVVGADRVEKTKPAPDMAIYACEIMQVSPTDAVIAGDNITDMNMGNNAGMNGCIGVLTGVCRKEQLEEVSDVVVNSIADIKIE